MEYIAGYRFDYKYLQYFNTYWMTWKDGSSLKWTEYPALLLAAPDSVIALQTGSTRKNKPKMVDDLTWDNPKIETVE